MKKLLPALVIIQMCISVFCGRFYAYADESRTLLKGEINYTVPKGTAIKLKVASIASYDMHLFNRDIENNPLPAVLGQEITSRVTEDIYVGDNKVIPVGSVFYGRVDEITEPGRMFHNGTLKIAFTRLKLPNGKVYAFKAYADNISKLSMKKKLKNAGVVASYAAGGAIVGTIAAFYFTGLHTTISTHGYNIAGGAAGGALLAAGYILLKKGQKATLEPGDKLNLHIDSNLLLPIAQAPQPEVVNKVKGLNIQIVNAKVVSDGTNGKILKFDLTFVNKTDKTFKAIDFYIKDDNGNKCALIQPTDIEGDYMFTIEPYSMDKLKLSFECLYPKLNQRLVIVDHNTRQICHEEKINFTYD